MAINFGGLRFSEPAVAALWTPPAAGGVYSVMVLDACCRPKPYRPIFVGQAQAFGALRGHARYRDWLGIAGSEWNLYVATCALPQAQERERAERMLIREYRPECHPRNPEGESCRAQLR